MQYVSTTAPPPDPRIPKSLGAVIFNTLLVVLIFHPIPAASATNATIHVSQHSDIWAPPVADADQSDVLAAFIPPDMPWSAAHRGIDLAAPSTEVLAPGSGEVTFVGVVVDRQVISIRHNNGLISSLEPVESTLNVGDVVSQGQVIGKLSAGSSHCDTQCVHWGVRKPDAWHIGSTQRDLYIDPAFLLGWNEPSVLWPVHSDPIS